MTVAKYPVIQMCEIEPIVYLKIDNKFWAKDTSRLGEHQTGWSHISNAVWEDAALYAPLGIEAFKF